MAGRDRAALQMPEVLQTHIPSSHLFLIAVSGKTWLHVASLGVRKLPLKPGLLLEAWPGNWGTVAAGYGFLEPVSTSNYQTCAVGAG